MHDLSIAHSPDCVASLYNLEIVHKLGIPRLLCKFQDCVEHNSTCTCVHVYIVLTHRTGFGLCIMRPVHTGLSHNNTNIIMYMYTLRRRYTLHCTCICRVQCLRKMYMCVQALCDLFQTLSIIQLAWVEFCHIFTLQYRGVNVCCCRSSW